MPSYSRTFEPVGSPATKRPDQGMTAAEFKRQAAATIAAGERAVELMRAKPAATAASRRKFTAQAPKINAWAELNRQRFAPYLARAQRVGLSAFQISALQALQTPGQIESALQRLESAR